LHRLEHASLLGAPTRYLFTRARSAGGEADPLNLL
jgi:hypothetical protein